MNQNPAFVANAAIGPSLFVKQVSAFRVEVAGDANRCIGVSHEGTREAPIPGITPLAAAAEESVRIYGMGEVCEVICGAAVTANAYVTPDADGKAVTAVAGEEYCGRALNTTTVAGQRLRIQVMFGELET